MKRYEIEAVTEKDRADYPEAVLKALEAIRKAGLKLIISGWLRDKIEAGNIRLMEGKELAPAGTYALDFGDRWRGKSPEWVAENCAGPFVSLLQFLRLVLAEPSILDKELYLDFPADEVRSGREWPGRPFLVRGYGGAWLSDYWASGANAGFGPLGCAGEGDSGFGDSASPGNSALGLPAELEINGITYVRKEESADS